MVGLVFMIVKGVTESEKDAYDKLVSHIIQSWEWGEFRKKAGIDLTRIGHFEGNRLTCAYQLTFHTVPFFKNTIGYFPKGPMPNEKIVETIGEIGRQKNAAFIKIEPDVIIDRKTTNDTLASLSASEQLTPSRTRLTQLGLVSSK